MTDVLYQSLKMMRDRPLSMSLLNLVISSGKYSSSLSTISKVPINTQRQMTVDFYYCLYHKTNSSSRQNPLHRKHSTRWTPTILTGIKACDWCTQDLDKVAHAAKVLIHVSKVSVNMITIPSKQEKNQCHIHTYKRKIGVKSFLETSYEMLPSTDCFSQCNVFSNNWLNVDYFGWSRLTSQADHSSCAGCLEGSSQAGSVGCGTDPTESSYYVEEWGQSLPSLVTSL